MQIAHFITNLIQSMTAPIAIALFFFAIVAGISGAIWYSATHVSTADPYEEWINKEFEKL